MSGKLGNFGRAILRDFSDLFEAEGFKRGPDHLVVGNGITPVANVLDAYEPYEIVAFREGDESSPAGFDAVTSGSIDIVGGGNANIGPNLATGEYYFEALSFLLEFDAAGAIAFNGKSLFLRLRLHVVESSGALGNLIAEVVSLRPWTRVQTGRLFYRWTLSGFTSDFILANNSFETTIHKSWSGFVPGNCGLRLLVGAEDGTAFPSGCPVEIGGIARRKRKPMLRVNALTPIFVPT